MKSRTVRVTAALSWLGSQPSGAYPSAAGLSSHAPTMEMRKKTMPYIWKVACHPEPGISSSSAIGPKTPDPAP